MRLIGSSLPDEIKENTLKFRDDKSISIHEFLKQNPIISVPAERPYRYYAVIRGEGGATGKLKNTELIEVGKLKRKVK